ncbi:FixH family protein [Roseiarcaceae bacterium H3SJ34-1]|uniref:FixH family protein n=1 Tax=Terripilifer ovatus TaxID=3032367 RepID=UPI003AB9A18A|nr:FixH family protein [Roseiarcaceae bacterium H3SJ34-1]
MIVLLAAVLGATTFIGYLFGQGRLTLPSSITASLPPSLAAGLTRSNSVTADLPTELKNYAFELIDTQAKQGEVVLAVRLVRKPTGQPVTGAIIFGRRLDMAPEGMPTMTAKLEPQPTTKPGVYLFKTDLAMEGAWQLSLAAKVQGEMGTVANKLVLKAAP